MITCMYSNTNHMITPNTCGYKSRDHCKYTSYKSHDPSKHCLYTSYKSHDDSKHLCINRMINQNTKSHDDSNVFHVQQLHDHSNTHTYKYVVYLTLYRFCKYRINAYNFDNKYMYIIIHSPVIYNIHENTIIIRTPNCRYAFLIYYWYQDVVLPYIHVQSS